jgi:hypothetical protein
VIYLLALLPATALMIAGYFVLFLATRSDGALRSFGRYLAFWAFTLAGLVMLGALFAAAHAHHHHGWREHCPWGGPAPPGLRPAPPPAVPGPPEEARPAEPAPASGLGFASRRGAGRM